jgi:hypothetical protein
VGTSETLVALGFALDQATRPAETLAAPSGVGAWLAFSYQAGGVASAPGGVIKVNLRHGYNPCGAS